MMDRALTKMMVNELIALRKRVEDELYKRQEELKKNLATIRGFSAPSKRSDSPMLGKKVAPKYKSPQGETWAGRGAKPRWLAALLKDKRNKLENYRIKAG